VGPGSPQNDGVLPSALMVCVRLFLFGRMETVFAGFRGGEVKDARYFGGGYLGRKESISLLSELFSGQFRFDEWEIRDGIGGEQRNIFTGLRANNQAIRYFTDRV